MHDLRLRLSLRFAKTFAIAFFSLSSSLPGEASALSKLGMLRGISVSSSAGGAHELQPLGQEEQAKELTL